MITRSLDLFLTEDEPPEFRSCAKVREVEASTALSRSNLPGLDYALNPYVGCEHGCVYCYAPHVVKRDPAKWAAELEVRGNLPNLLAKELPGKKGVIGLGTVTDPYQPIEKAVILTRRCLMEITRSRCSISLLTKSDLVVRDLELLLAVPRTEVGFSITGIDTDLSRRLEPGASLPKARLEAMKRCNESGLDTYALIGPLFPFFLREDIEGLVDAIAATGVKRVMVDRLRHRPGTAEAMSKALKGSAYEHRIDAPLMAETYVAEACERMALKMVQAF